MINDLRACLAIVQNLKSMQAERDQAIELVKQLKAELEALSFTPSGQ